MELIKQIIMSNIPQNFIFRLSFPCHKVQEIPENITPMFLDEQYRIPYHCRRGHITEFDKRKGKQPELLVNDFNDEGKKIEFDFRIGWHEQGLIITVLLEGKMRKLNCNPLQLETSDGLHFVLDTRDVRDLQRGDRYCHRFLFLPITSSDIHTPAPRPYWFPIHRAKEHPNPVDITTFKMASEITGSGCRFSVLIPTETLTGFDPEEHPRLGFHFSFHDSELGNFDLQHPETFPVEETPSLWSVLVLQ